MSAEDQLHGPARVLAVVFFMLLSALTAVFEVFLVPVYLGSVIFPITLVFAVVGNVFFARAVRLLTGSPALSGLPLLAWLVVVYALGFKSHPKGDVLLPGYGQAQYVALALPLVGIVAGAVAVLWEPRVAPAEPEAATLTSP